MKLAGTLVALASLVLALQVATLGWAVQIERRLTRVETLIERRAEAPPRASSQQTKGEGDGVKGS